MKFSPLIEIEICSFGNKVMPNQGIKWSKCKNLKSYPNLNVYECPVDVGIERKVHF